MYRAPTVGWPWKHPDSFEEDEEDIYSRESESVSLRILDEDTASTCSNSVGINGTLLTRRLKPLKLPMGLVNGNKWKE